MWEEKEGGPTEKAEAGELLVNQFKQLIRSKEGSIQTSTQGG